MKLLALLITVMLLTIPAIASAGESPAVYFITPQSGDVVGGEFTVRFGLRGMGVAPAGVDQAKTGHHHLLIDLDTLPPMDAPLPKTEQVRHFGGGQTETRLSLPPGEHTLQLVLGDYAHTPHNPPVMSGKITVTVTE